MRTFSLLPLGVLVLALGVSDCFAHLVGIGGKGLARAQMGVTDPDCDDGKTNLEVDWDGSPDAYTCSEPQSDSTQESDLLFTTAARDVAADFKPEHLCMDVSVDYAENIPTTVNHRPLWAVYGEYKYVPPQRWTHNIEHGAVVLLYHPCANAADVEKLRQLVRGCIRKHIITPYNKLSMETPLALATWGSTMQIATMDHPDMADNVRNFIKKSALKGTEGRLSLEGQYDYQLLVKATAPAGSDMDDSVLCPNQ